MMERRSADRQGQALLIETATGIAVAVLIAVTWMFTLALTRADERDNESRLLATLGNLSNGVEWQIAQSIDRAQAMLDRAHYAWSRSRSAYDVGIWAEHNNGDLDSNLQLFLLDAGGKVRSATDPEMVGRDVLRDSRFVDFARSAHVFRRGDDIGLGVQTGELVLRRPLVRADGTPEGALLLLFDPWRGMRNLPRWNVGKDAVIALLRKNGTARMLMPSGETGELQRDNTLSLFDLALAQPSGQWSGVLLADGVERDFSYSRLLDLDLLLVIGVNRVDSLAPTHSRTEAVLAFAALTSVLLAIGAVLIIRQIEAARLREERLAEDRNLIESAYGELAQAKANSEARNAEIEATLAGMSDGVMLLDPDLRLVNWNDRFPERIGIPRHILRVGMNFEDILRYQVRSGEFGEIDVKQEVTRRITAMRALRGSITVERVRHDGTAIELRRSRLPNGGLVTLYIDVSARKAAEDALRVAQRLAQEASEQKSRFVAIVSHEIRTPLNAVINCLALLDESDLAPSQRRLSNTAREAGEALMELVNDILELSNVEAGKLQIRPSVFDFPALLEGVRAMFQPAASKRDIRIVTSIAPEMPKHLRADPGRLRQVLMNLASNAAKFPHAGIVTLRAEILPSEAGPAQLRIMVQDPGPAIPTEDAIRLFTPFTRLFSPETAGTPGTGLGLTICDRLVRAMGGEIGLRRSSAGGNEFWFAIPVEPAEGKGSAATQGTVVVSLRQRLRARLLIVEDIAANHLVAATMLRRDGFRVDVAESGAAAIALVQHTPYDLIFMDLIMPGMDGLEATRRIRALPGPLSRIPIVALTATTAEEDRLRCLASGMDELLGKPVRAAAMFDLVNSYLGSATRSAITTAVPMEQAASVQVPVIDDERLAELRYGLPPKTVLSLVEQCLADVVQRLPTLRSALKGDDMKAIESAAHALAGMSASYGLAAFEARMRRIIRHARAGEIDAAREAGEGADGDFAVAAETIRLQLRDAVA